MHHYTSHISMSGQVALKIQVFLLNNMRAPKQFLGGIAQLPTVHPKNLQLTIQHGSACIIYAASITGHAYKVENRWLLHGFSQCNFFFVWPYQQPIGCQWNGRILFPPRPFRAACHSSAFKGSITFAPGQNKLAGSETAWSLPTFGGNEAWFSDSAQRRPFRQSALLPPRGIGSDQKKGKN